MTASGSMLLAIDRATMRYLKKLVSHTKSHYLTVALLALFLSFYVNKAQSKTQTDEIALDYPTDVVRIVVAFPAGGAADMLARIMAEKLPQKFDQSFIVENRPGAGGTVGATYVARAKPDGHTLLLGVTASQTIAPFIHENLNYDPSTDFEPVATLASIPVVLVINPSIDANDPRQLVTLAKNSEPSLTYASSGIGAIPHLTGVLFSQAQDIELLHIPFQGSAPALADILAGRVDMIFDHLPTSLPSIKDGKLKALGVASDKRAKALPEVPTLQEAGVEDVTVSSWFGILAPANTPKKITSLINQEINNLLLDSDIQKEIAALGAEPLITTPEEFSDIINADALKWEQVVQIADVEKN